VLDELHPPALTYLDADLCFLGSPEAAHRALDDTAIGLVAHRFPEALAHLAPYGRFNVGWVHFADRIEARRCVARWLSQCLEWCHERVEPGRFADQAYLDDWPAAFQAAVLDHPGVDVGPWNVGRHALSVVEGEPRVDGLPLVCYHFHGLRRVGRRTWDAGLRHYGTVLDDVLRTHVYAPYLAELVRLSSRLRRPLPIEAPSTPLTPSDRLVVGLGGDVR
jgi:hypothetical protein